MKDYQLTKDLDLLIDESGDFKTAPSLQQHRQILLITKPSDWTLNPKAGCDILQALNDTDTMELTINIKEQFFRDGVAVQFIKITEGKIYIQ